MDLAQKQFLRLSVLLGFGTLLTACHTVHPKNPISVQNSIITVQKSIDNNKALNPPIRIHGLFNSHIFKIEGDRARYFWSHDHIVFSACN